MEVFSKDFKTLLLTTLFLLFSILPCHAAQNRIIDAVEIIPYPSGTKIHILFNYRLQYISHTPAKEGDYLRIQLRPIFTPGSTVADLAVAEYATWQSVPIIPLSEIRYDGTKGEYPTFEIRFLKVVSYKVEPAPDLRSIIILLPEYGAIPVTTEREAISAVPVTAKPEEKGEK